MAQETHGKRRKINLTEFSRPHFTESKTNICGNGVKKVFYLWKLCDRAINGTKNSNLYVHLQKRHHEIVKNIDNPDETIEKKRSKLLLDCVELVTVNGNPFNRSLDSGL